MASDFVPRRRIEILTALSDHGEMSAKAIVEHVPIRLNTMRRLLLFYHRQGLVKREKYGRDYWYKLSEAGWNRLQWYKRHPPGEKHVKGKWLDENKVVEGEG